MGNNTCKAEGISTVQLKLNDGTVRDLQGVRYIPDLKKSLISLSALESKGYSITLKDGGLTVSLGNLIVMIVRKEDCKSCFVIFVHGSVI